MTATIIDSTTLRAPTNGGAPLRHEMSLSDGQQRPLDKQRTLEVANERAAPVPEAKIEEKEERLPHGAMALAKQQKEIRRLQEIIKAKEQEFEKSKTSYEKDYIPKSRLSEDPLTALEEMGISYDQLVQRALTQTSPAFPEVKELTTKVQQMEDALKKQTESQQEREKSQYDHAINQMRSEVKRLVSEGTDFELIKADGREEAVIALIEETFREDNVVMSVEDAAKEIEEHLFERALKIAQSEKVRARLAPKPDLAQVKEEATPRQPQPTQLRTITNAQTTALSRPKTQAERIERAKLAFMGQLK